MATLPDNNCQSYNDHLEDEYCNLQNLVFKYDEAISAILTGGHASYTIDTGQTTQTVTRHNITSVQAARNVAASRLAELAARLRKTKAVKQVRPGW